MADAPALGAGARKGVEVQILSPTPSRSSVQVGVSLNRNNGVLHDIFNIHATGSDGSTLSINIVDHLSMSANGQVNVFMDCA
jgi:hypothetical protein